MNLPDIKTGLTVSKQTANARSGRQEWVLGAGIQTVAVMVGVSAAEQNAKRLAACWNACKGIPTDELEQWVANKK